jgi:hypothetical protein
MAVDPRQRRAQNAPEGRIATRDEVRLAIESLTPEETAKLKSFSKLLAFNIRRYAWGIGPGDMLQDAVVSLLDEGHRSWNPDRVDFVGVLIGAMRSIASNLKQKGKKVEPPPLLASDLAASNQDGEERPTALETAPDPRQNPEAALLTAELATEEQLLADIEELFEDDPVASLVLEGWKNDMDGPAITESLGITKKEFNAAVKRIRRAREARWPGGKPHVQ